MLLIMTPTISYRTDGLKLRLRIVRGREGFDTRALSKMLIVRTLWEWQKGVLEHQKCRKSDQISKITISSNGKAESTVTNTPIATN